MPVVNKKLHHRLFVNDGFVGFIIGTRIEWADICKCFLIVKRNKVEYDINVTPLFGPISCHMGNITGDLYIRVEGIFKNAGS